MGVCTQICSMPMTLLEIPTSISSRRPPLQQKVPLQSCLVLAQCYASHLLCWSTALVGRPQCSPLENLLLVPLCLLDSLLQPKPPLTNAVSSSLHYSCLGGGWVANLPKNREMERFWTEAGDFSITSPCLRCALYFCKFSTHCEVCTAFYQSSRPGWCGIDHLYAYYEIYDVFNLCIHFMCQVWFLTS